MKIDLQYFLNKNKITLKNFCEINNLSSFEELCSHCISKNIIPVKLDFYNHHNPDRNKIEKKVNEVSKKTEAKKSQPRRSRKTSKVTKKRSASTKDNS